MAHDGYRSSSEHPSYYDYSDPKLHYSNSYRPTDPYRPKSRQSSRDRSDVRTTERSKLSQPHYPINEADNAAFVDKTPDNAAMNPELIAQITENVIKQLRTVPLESGTPIQATHPQYPPPPPQQPIPQSPTSRADVSPPIPTRNVYTPPSPEKHSDYANHASPEVPSNIIYPSPPSPPELSSFQNEERMSSSRVSVSSDTNNARPKGPVRLSTSKEETTLEKIWGQLFDEEGRPTARLGQFLRGLAVHLIEDCEPLHSIVITPQKMQAYYASVRLPTEAYPWSAIFEHKDSYISRMYRDLECQHHLVQEHFDKRPEIPGLTPVGFERWATLLIQAHPDEEFERLKKAVLEMPISNPDDKKERFPKDISRRLFPTTEDRRVRERLQKAMVEHADIILPQNSASDTLKPPQNDSTARPVHEAHTPIVPISIPSNIERERKPYSNTPTECAIDDTNPPLQPLERERKPYRVQPSGGRIYEQDGRTTIQPNQAMRSNSTTERARPIPIKPQVPRTQGDLPPPEIHQIPRGASNIRRRHSPSFSAGTNDFRRSDGDLRTFQPSSYQSTSIPPPEGYEDDAPRYAREQDMRRGEYARRQADEDAGRYGGSPSSRARYDPRMETGDHRRGSNQTDEDYYRSSGRGIGTEYSQGYGGGTYR